MGVVQLHVYPPPTPLIKRNDGDNPEKYFVNIKLCRDPTSGKLDLYELKISIFDDGKMDEFLLLVRNFNMTCEASVMIKTSVKVPFLCKIFHGEVLRQFDTMCDDV